MTHFYKPVLLRFTDLSSLYSADPQIQTHTSLWLSSSCRWSGSQRPRMQPQRFLKETVLTVMYLRPASSAAASFHNLGTDLTAWHESLNQLIKESIRTGRDVINMSSCRTAVFPVTGILLLWCWVVLWHPGDTWVMDSTVRGNSNYVSADVFHQRRESQGRGRNATSMFSSMMMSNRHMSGLKRRTVHLLLREWKNDRN